MKKILLALTAVTFGAAALHAQTRLSLYEEFSGENCGPCAAYNPGLWSLISTPGNESKVLLIKYQCPIPSAGPIYNEYKTVTNARLSYYAVNSAPYGIQNGNEVKGNIVNYKQSDINTSVANPAPFNLSVTHQWNAAGDSVYASITLNTPNAYAPTGANLKLRVALIEHLEYCTAPGNNGETEFHNVVREMYPDASGTALSNTWTAAQSQSITIGGKVPSRVDKSNERAVIVVWIQDDANKNIVQAAQSAEVSLPVDASVAGGTVPVLSCATGSVSVPTSVVLTNMGSTPLTSATIYYKLDNGSYSSTSWTGSLAPGGNATVSIPAQTMGVGDHVIYDSVDMPNAALDVNAANNSATVKVTVRDAAPATIPVIADFENAGSAPANWTLFDEDGNTANWMPRSNAGYNGSIYSLMHLNYGYPAGEQNTAILPGTLPAAGTYALDFYLAYAQYKNENDKLEVVYSSDCGTTWNTIWSDQGSSMSTHTPVDNAQFVPVDGDWRAKSIDVSAVPAGAMIGFRATSDYGNNLYIDNVNLRTGAAVGIRNIAAAATEVKLYPNPAQEATTLQFSLAKAGNVQVSVLDATGRTLAVVADANMQAGAQRFEISTSSLAAGMYQVVIRSEEGTSTQRLSVVK